MSRELGLDARTRWGAFQETGEDSLNMSQNRRPNG